MASPNLSEIITTTLYNRSGKLADNVTKNNALLKRLKEKGNVKPVSGGRQIVQELEYAENGTFVRYSGYDTLNVSPSDVLSAAVFDYKQAAVAISISGLEELQNAGKEQIIDLLESRIKNAERTLMNNIAVDCYSDGTGSGSKQIGGLQLLVADSPATGSPGGISRVNYTFWRNQAYDATTDGGAAVTAANIQTYMNHVYLLCVRGADAPDLLIADNTYFKAYWASLQAIQRIQSDSSASAGFKTLQYMGADVVYDGSSGAAQGGCPANHMYFLNTNYIHFRPHSKRNFVPLNPDRFSVNQDAMVKLIGFAGNMTLSNAMLQGVLKD